MGADTAAATRAVITAVANTTALNITAANIIIQVSTIIPANITRTITPITTTTTTVGIMTRKVG